MKGIRGSRGRKIFYGLKTQHSDIFIRIFRVASIIFYYTAPIGAQLVDITTTPSAAGG